MNILKVIAEHLVAGLDHAAIAVKLDVENGIQVSEDWLKKITGADGFEHVISQVGGDARAILNKGVTEVEHLDTEAREEVAKIEEEIKDHVEGATPAPEVAAEHASPAPEVPAAEAAPSDKPAE